MKLPFVSRQHHEDTVSLWQRIADSEHENAQQLRVALADMGSRYHMLKLQGFSEPTVAQPVERPKPDPIKSAIRARCRGNTDLMRQMEAQAENDLAGGMSPAQVLLAIQKGVSPDDTFGISSSSTTTHGGTPA